MDRNEILGIKVTSISLPELNHRVREWLADNRKRVILYSNIYGINLALKYNWMKEQYNRADVVLCDGTGVLWASRILGRRISERIALTDWGWILLKLIEEKGASIYFLGNTQDVIARSEERIKKIYPKLSISGSHHGFFDIAGVENRKIIESINSSGTDVLLVGMGMPKQEKWVADNQKELNVKLIVTCGAFSNYLAGVQKRCPEWISRSGLEWLYRFIHEPVRLFGKYFPGNFVFFFRIFKSIFSK